MKINNHSKNKKHLSIKYLIFMIKIKWIHKIMKKNKFIIQVDKIDQKIYINLLIN